MTSALGGGLRRAVARRGTYRNQLSIPVHGQRRGHDRFPRQQLHNQDAAYGLSEHPHASLRAGDTASSPNAHTQSAPAACWSTAKG